MAYEIRPSREMPGDLKWLSAGERAAIEKALPKYLRDDPARRSTHRKELDPNPFDAPWELRLGDLRVLYSVDEEANLVRALRAGRKPGNTLYIRGLAYDSEGEAATRMTAKTAATAQVDDEARRRWEEGADEEQRALSRHPEFRAMLARTAEAMKRDGGITLEELHESLGLTPEDEAAGERLLAELEQQTEEEEAARLAAHRRNGASPGATKKAR